MGYWNETCCITRIPIYQEQEVVMIDFYNQPDVTTFDHFRKMKVKRILKGTYNDYGSINELDEKIKEEEHKKSDDFCRVFILKTAWDER
jgi:hypothetical protein